MLRGAHVCPELDEHAHHSAKPIPMAKCIAIHLCGVQTRRCGKRERGTTTVLDWDGGGPKEEGEEQATGRERLVADHDRLERR